MSVRIKRFLLFLAIFTVSSSFNSLGSQPLSFLTDSVRYVWPTDASRQISSTFAETRSAHLHAGLDIRTWGQEGYKVFATRSGTVYRIATGARGYGNVVYLKHRDGSFSVYAHLNRFEPELQSYVDSIRMEDHRFEIDLVIEDEGFSFDQGELIAYSGGSGAGPPHLHFELRSPDNEPVNPLLTNLSVRDTRPPVFRQLGIEYLDPSNFRLVDFEFIRENRRASGYDFGEIEVNGPVGLSVDVHDRADRTYNAYAVYTLTMVHQSDTLFHSRVDHFSYDDSRHMFLDRSYPLLAQTRRGFQRLYKVDANRLPFYKKAGEKGIINFPRGSYPIEIIATDIYGNESLAKVTIKVNRDPVASEIASVPAYPEPDESVETQVRAIDRYRFEESPPLLVSSSNVDIPMHRLVSGNFIHSVTSTGKAIVPGETRTLFTADRKVWIEFPKESLHDTLNIKLDVQKLENEIRFNFTPDRIPLNAPVYFNTILPQEYEDNGSVGLFSVDRNRGRYYFMGAVNQNGLIRSPLHEISSLAIMEDTEPPKVGRMYFDQDLAGNTVLKLRTSDELTGIDYNSSIITVNGERAIVKYDPDKNLLIYYHPGFIPSGDNIIAAVIYDGMGNKTQISRSLSYSR